VKRRALGFAAAKTAAWLILLFLVLPMFIVVPVSLTPKRYLSLPQGEISFAHYLHLFTSEQWLSSAEQSLFIALTTMALAVTFGTAFAIGCWRLSSRSTELARAVMLTPLIAPPIVHALGFYLAWVKLGLIDTFFGVILAHFLISVPFVVITVSTSLANLDLKLELAARNLGATPRQTIWFVIIPLIKPGILAGAVFAFIMSWDEVIVVLFITSRKVYTLPRTMWDGLRENVDPTIAALATTLIIVTFAGLLVDFLVRGRRNLRDDSVSHQ
jgi:putative spermidine/putrescine transport system permease protein